MPPKAATSYLLFMGYIVVDSSKNLCEIEECALRRSRQDLIGFLMPLFFWACVEPKVRRQPTSAICAGNYRVYRRMRLLATIIQNW
jgi:hypothetical protein